MIKELLHKLRMRERVEEKNAFDQLDFQYFVQPTLDLTDTKSLLSQFFCPNIQQKMFYIRGAIDPAGQFVR